MFWGLRSEWVKASVVLKKFMLHKMKYTFTSLVIVLTLFVDHWAEKVDIKMMDLMRREEIFWATDHSGPILLSQLSVSTYSAPFFFFLFFFGFYFFLNFWNNVCTFKGARHLVYLFYLSFIVHFICTSGAGTLWEDKVGGGGGGQPLFVINGLPPPPPSQALFAQSVPVPMICIALSPYHFIALSLSLYSNAFGHCKLYVLGQILNTCNYIICSSILLKNPSVTNWQQACLIIQCLYSFLKLFLYYKC